MDAARQETPVKRTVDDVLKDFRGRRKGLIKALTTDFEEFDQKCDSKKKFLCQLYGLPNGSWKVIAPISPVPPAHPEPIVGINIWKEGMHTSDWLSLVAAHSDAWLMSLAFFFGGLVNFDNNDRKRLFRMINRVPTVLEVINGKHRAESAQPSTDQRNENQAEPSQKMVEMSNTGPSGKMPQSRTFALDVGSVPLDSTNGVSKRPKRQTKPPVWSKDFCMT